ncbi:initiation factor 2 [Ascobolus immersus RN42]|uniref:Translation initiation factor IF-2, mitochondrial n=1 Tax=Ascobolus immersus RN42 TaxID=1160509 RepID=A0A3N4I8U6_ASCIM|nr:initiation factor 2 [Ascobolus immersus RN42]
MEAEMAAMTEKEEKRRAKERKRRERERNTVPPIYLPEFITVEHLATMLKVPVERFMGQIRNMGFEGVAYDQVLNSEDAGLIAAEYGFEPIVDRDTGKDLLPRPDVTPEERAALPPRPPVVTIMGHVDHGKTTLLDYLRKSAVAEGEHGGITQHIGAFSVKLESGKTITFLDTPGHAAFLSMRERGATVTDIVILVVAADDSVMPQTIEAIKHAKAANVPIIVAVNKCDKPDADPERVKLDLARHNVEIEDFGGDVPVVLVSGKTGLGMAEMEETIMAVSEVLDMRAEETGQAEGWVLEASTKKRGRVATVLVRRGTLRVGDILVAGTTWAKVRTLQDHAGNTLESAGPGQPVEVDGWRENPEAGALAIQAADEGRAREAVDYRLEKIERVKAMEDMEVVNEQRRLQKIAREKEVELEREKKFQKKGVKVLPLIIKADVQGSVEAVINQVAALGNDLVQTKIIRGAAGAVSEFDVDHAEAADGYIITFNSTPSPDITNYARKKGVTIISSTIIYRLVDDLKLLLESHLPPIITERTTCTVEIAQIIPVNAGGKKGVPIAGCRVTNGTLMRNGLFRVFRGATGPNGEGGEKVWEGRLSSLRHFKKDVESMKKGGECGVGFEGLKNFEVGDLVVGYEVVEEKRKL